MPDTTTCLVTGGTGSRGRMIAASCLEIPRNRRVVVHGRDGSKQREVLEHFADAGDVLPSPRSALARTLR